MQMRIIFKTLAALALAMPSWAAIQFTSFPGAVEAGQQYIITWTTDDTGVSSL
jgi:hypothetical protein